MPPQCASRDVVLVGQLESRQAVENADAIASTPGLDAVMIGPADLAVDCGGLGLDGPELNRMVRGVEETCRRSGHVMGITASDGAGAASRIARGHRFVVVATDAALLARSAGAVVTTTSASG